MWAWLLSEVDVTRPHEIGPAIAWHGRAMVFAWGILAPLAVVMARYFKIMPGQDWPRELDNQVWWRSHWIGHSCVLALSLGGLFLVWRSPMAEISLHGCLGYATLLGLTVQVALGVLRGTKGGPTAPAPDGSFTGDHYDMTPRRRSFERVHKTAGYAVLGLASVTILFGLWHANGPRWMWIMLILWWLALCAASMIWHRQGRVIGSYQAIWGPDPKHPGNRLQQEEKDYVRSDRGDRFRTH